MSEAKFFPTRAAWRRWLERNHAKETELIVGFHKVGSGMRSITYEESVEEALCFGWIDGVRRSIDGASYSMRFTPRKPKSYWSDVNIARAERLIERGRMAPAGLAAFGRRDPDEDRRYSFERHAAELAPPRERAFRRNRPAWAWFESQPNGYRRTATFWVESAKREETRERRLRSLIEHSARDERLPQFVSPARRRT